MRSSSMVWWLVACVACGGAPPTASPSIVVGGQASSRLAGPPDEARFASNDVTTPPPPPPVRQIDRDGAPAPTDHKSREVDKTLPTQTDAQSSAQSPAQMLVYTAHVTMAVYQVSAALDAIEDVARTSGGYLSSRNDTQIRIRVPRARFEDALHKIESGGDVVHRDISAEDVTDAYVDTEARLKNARAVRDRLQALLEKAAVKEAIEIQRELERVTQEIEVYEGRLKLLADRVAFSTIEVTFQARGDVALTGSPRLPFPWIGELGLPHLLDLGGPR
jgi:hypothetical protein